MLSTLQCEQTGNGNQKCLFSFHQPHLWTNRINIHLILTRWTCHCVIFIVLSYLRVGIMYEILSTLHFCSLFTCAGLMRRGETCNYKRHESRSRQLPTSNLQRVNCEIIAFVITRSSYVYSPKISIRIAPSRLHLELLHVWLCRFKVKVKLCFDSVFTTWDDWKLDYMTVGGYINSLWLIGGV